MLLQRGVARGIGKCIERAAQLDWRKTPEKEAELLHEAVAK